MFIKYTYMDYKSPQKFIDPRVLKGTNSLKKWLDTFGYMGVYNEKK